MATLTLSTRFQQDGTAYNADPAGEPNINTILAAMSVTGIVAADVAAANKDGTAATPSLRTLGTGAAQAAAGNDSRFTDARTATGFKFGSTTQALGSTPATAGLILGFDGTNWTPQAASASAAVTGTGTLVSSSTAVTGTGTLFTTQLKVGYLITVAAKGTRTITAIADATHLTIDSAFSSAAASDAFTFVVITPPRPYNVESAKSSNFSVSSADAGALFVITRGAGGITATLGAASGFNQGTTIGFIIADEAAGTFAIAVTGGDTIDGVNAGKSYATRGASCLLECDGSANWRMVTERRAPGTLLQRQSLSSSIGVTIATQIPFDNTIPQNTEGDLLFTLAITPKVANSVIRVTGKVNVSSAQDNRNCTVAVFCDQNGTPANSVYATGVSWANHQYQSMQSVPINFDASFGVVTSHVFTVRVGTDGSGGMYVNKDSAGVDLNGGVRFSNLFLEEYCT